MQHRQRAHNQSQHFQQAPLRRCYARGYTLIDMLVAMAVLSLLVSLLLPAVANAMRRARMVIAQSNLRQIGHSMEVWSQDHNGMLPESVFTERRTNLQYMPKYMQVLYNHDEFREGWDGLGKLIEEGYLTPEVFYAPAHEGGHPLERYEKDFAALQAGVTPQNPIYSNFFYRWLYGEERTSALIPPDLTIVSDGIRTKADFNHRTGAYVMRIDASVEWQADTGEFIYGQLPSNENAVGGLSLRGAPEPSPKWNGIIFALDRGVEEASLRGGDYPWPNPGDEPPRGYPW